MSQTSGIPTLTNADGLAPVIHGPQWFAITMHENVQVVNPERHVCTDHGSHNFVHGVNHESRPKFIASISALLFAAISLIDSTLFFMKDASSILAVPSIKGKVEQTFCKGGSTVRTPHMFSG